MDVEHTGHRMIEERNKMGTSALVDLYQRMWKTGTGDLYVFTFLSQFILC